MPNDVVSHLPDKVAILSPDREKALPASYDSRASPAGELSADSSFGCQPDAGVSLPTSGLGVHVDDIASKP